MGRWVVLAERSDRHFLKVGTINVTGLPELSRGGVESLCCSGARLAGYESINEALDASRLSIAGSLGLAVAFDRSEPGEDVLEETRGRLGVNAEGADRSRRGVDSSGEVSGARLVGYESKKEALDASRFNMAGNLGLTGAAEP